MRKRNDASRKSASSSSRPGTRNSSVATREAQNEPQMKTVLESSNVVVEAFPPLQMNPAAAGNAQDSSPSASAPEPAAPTEEVIVGTEAAELVMESLSMAPSSECSVLPKDEQGLSLAKSTEPCVSVIDAVSVDTPRTESSLSEPPNMGTETPPAPKAPESGTKIQMSKSGLDIQATRLGEAVAESRKQTEIMNANLNVDVAGNQVQPKEQIANGHDCGEVTSTSLQGGSEISYKPQVANVVEHSMAVPMADPMPLGISEHVAPSDGSCDPSLMSGKAQGNSISQTSIAFDTNQVPVPVLAAGSNGSPSRTTSNPMIDLHSSKDGQPSCHLVSMEAPKELTTNPLWVEGAPSLAHFASTYGNNMVSSVEGETVLIVENLGLVSQVPSKVEGTVSGVAADSTVNELQTEGDEKASTERILGEGNDLVGKKIKKKFGKKFFEGHVVEFDPEQHWYKVVYEDGDEEDLDVNEVRKLLSLAEAQEDEQSARKRHQRSSNTANIAKRDADMVKSVGVPPMDEDSGLQISETSMDDSISRGLKRRLSADASVDAKAASLGSDSQPSSSSDEASEDDEDDEELVRRRSGKKPRRKTPSKKRKKTENFPDGERKGTSPHARPSARHKEPSVVKSQETSTEHRIATRSANAHVTSSDDHVSSRPTMKSQADSQDKLRVPTPAPEPESSRERGAKLIGRKTKKDFGGQFYFGEIVSYDNRVKYYKVRYEDGDEEELEWSELQPTLLPQEVDKPLRATEAPHEVVTSHSQVPVKENSRRGATPKSKGPVVQHEVGEGDGDLASSKRKWRKRIRTASVSVMMKESDDWNATSTAPVTAPEPPPPALAAVRFASASDADIFEYFGWGEVVNFERSKCPELRATHLLPTSLPVVHLAASRHHLVALTTSGQVWVWRCKHAGIRTRCNQWEHIALLDNRNVILVDISGPDVDRTSAGYLPEQEDQVPDPFYLAAVCSNGEDIILQGSQPHESVHTYQYDDELQHVGLRDALLQSNPGSTEDVGRIVQVSVGMVEAGDESPFVGYITDTDCVYIRSATRNYMEEVNLVTGYTGKPVKIQCGRVYHAIIMTDDGRAWTWGQGYYPGSNVVSTGLPSKWTSVCQPAVGTLVGRKVVDVGCYGEDFIALTSDGDVHQWTHALPNPALGVYNFPAIPVYGQGPNIASGDKLKHVAIGAGICAGISEGGKVHTWWTSMKGGFMGMVGPEREAATPLGRDEGTETAIMALGTKGATKVVCVAGSLLVVVKRKHRPRRGGRKKPDASSKGKEEEEDNANEDS